MKKNAIIKSMRTPFIILILMICLTICTTVSADYLDPKTITATSSDASGKIQTVAGGILGIVQVIGVAVAVIMLVVLAIKYISAAPNDKAEIKKHAVVYIVGAVVLFAAVGILQIIQNFSKIIGDGGTTPTTSQTAKEKAAADKAAADAAKGK